MLSRGTILAAVRRAIEPLAPVLAMWEGGSAAFGRDDAWSDLDLQLLVEEGAVGATFEVVERALEALSPIELRYQVAQPTWHGHAQTFYRLRDAGEYLLVDLAVMKRSSPNLFTERERHGERILYFDKTGEAATTGLDRETWGRVVDNARERLRVVFPLFQSLTRKELLRGNEVGALAFYQSHTLGPLCMLLGLRHCPDRFDFGPKYALHDLPAEVYAEFRDLWFVASAKDLPAKQARAEALFRRTLAELDTS